MYVDSIVNQSTYIRAFCDLGCLAFAAVSEQCVKKRRLTQFPIEPRELEQFAETDGVTILINSIATFSLDIDGYEHRIAAYVIPGQRDDLVLGKGWMERHDVVLEPHHNRLTIRWPSEVVVKTISVQPDETIKCVKAWALRTIVTRARKSGVGNEVKIFSASLADIQKTLQRKIHSDPSKVAPEWLKPYLHVFDREEAKKLPPNRPGIDHRIDLIDEKQPPNMPLYEMSKDQLLVLRKTLIELFDNGFIRASASAAGAPVIFVRKPGGGLRFCVDYRGLNAVSKKDSYPLPLIGETLKIIASARWISKVDVISAFHRIRMRVGDEWKTTFKTRLGSYEWLVTPFGLTGAPATFQRYINWVLREELDICCSAYLDDVIIYSNGSQAEHRKLVQKIVGKLGTAGLQLDIDKCQFEAQSIKYLGYIIEVGKGILVDPGKVEALRSWESPKSVRGVRGFLGFVNYYRQFVPEFSRVALPLTELTKKDAAFRWSTDCQEAFEMLKTAMMKAPVLVTWDPEKPTQVEADASGYAVGGALTQKTDGLWLPAAFCSRKLLPAEANYPIHDKEMLAIVYCIKTWRTELAGVSFVVLSDHRNLLFFRQVQRLNERQMRWAYELSEFNFDIVHRPGKTMVTADALSRREQDRPKDRADDRIAEREKRLLGSSESGNLRVKASSAWLANGDWDAEEEAPASEQEEEDPPGCPFLNDEMKTLWEEALLANKRYLKIRHAVRSGERKFPTAWGLPISMTECSIGDDGLLRWRSRTWIPAYEPLRTKIIQQIHDSPLTGHPGRDSLRALITREWTWPGLTQDIRRFLRNCHLCRQAVNWREAKSGLLKPLPVPERPWQDLTMDFITHLPESEGCKNLLVVTDRLSKNVILVPMGKIEAIDVAKALIRNVFCHHGFPKTMVSDRGPQFAGFVWKTICEQVSIERRLSTAFHPETDGATERANQEVKTYLRIFCAYSQDDWASFCPLAAVALNGRDSHTTGMSAFFMTHGYNIDVIDRIPEQGTAEGGNSPVQVAQNLLRAWSNASTVAQASMAVAQEEHERQANRSRRAAQRFEIGDRVYLRLKNIRTARPSRSLDWLALPYKVTEVVGSHSYRLDTPPGIHNVFHVDLLKPASSDPLPSQNAHYTENPPVEVAGQEEWEIERVVGHRRRGRGWQLHVSWTGYPAPTWEPLAALKQTAALEAYEAGLKGVPWA